MEKNIADFKKTAKQFWLEGCNIVLLKGKEPLHKWSRWQSERQNELAFEALPWDEADGFAIICGQQLYNELYFAAIDFDIKNLPEDVTAKGREALRHLPITQMERTPSGGQHWIYLSHTKPKTITAYHNICGLELLGEGKLCIMAPSAGYARLNDNSPTVVQDIETVFYEALEKAGIKTEKLSQVWFDNEDLAKQPYKGKDPPCIKALLKGTYEGQRNEFGIRLASYYINFKQRSLQNVRDEILKSWNRLNNPPLHWKELDSIVKSAVHGKYVYGCKDDVLSRFCEREKCPLATRDKVVFDEETKEKARQLLMDPAFFYKLGKVFELGFFVPKINKPRFVVEEERLKRLLGFLLLGAAKHGMTSIVKVLGEPGTAKDTMLRMWLELLPIKHVERDFLTAATLRYSEELQNADLLYIPDSPALRGETGRHLRFMRADDGGLISEYAMKDPETGEMTTKVVTLPVKAVATTSNVVTGDVALESGMWTLHTNSSPELTRKVKLEKLRFRAGKRPLFPEAELKVWKCAFHLLLTEEPMDELPKIPYAENLAEFLASERSESRRDPDKLCDLISIIAWARRFQKPKENRGEADWVDLYIALQLGWDAIKETISDLNQKEQQIFNAVKTAVGEDVTVRYVAEETGIPYKTCYDLLERMIEKGFINKDKKQGRNVYSILKEKQPKTLLADKDLSFKSPEQLVEQVLKYAGDFSSPPNSTVEVDCDNVIVDPLSGQIVTVQWNNGKHVVRVEDDHVQYPPFQFLEQQRSHQKTTETLLEPENKPVEQIFPLTRNELSPNIRNQQPQKQQAAENWITKREGGKVFLTTGEIWYECPHCTKNGELLFFASEHDLKIHMEKLHNNPLKIKINGRL
ncbi:MAG: helix-turn-helix domain-containing protein [Candidatus Bathyarchaeia archaeon]